MTRLKKAVLAVVALCVMYILGTGGYVYAFSQVDQTQKADVAIILGAATWYDEVSPVYEERLNHGIDLYKEGMVDYIMVTGGSVSEDGASDASLAKDYLLSQGIDEQVILVEDQSHTTKENMEYGKAIMDEHHLHRALIVSDPLHMARAMFFSHRAKLNAYSSPTPTTRYQSKETIIPFWLRETVLFMGYQWLNLLHIDT